MQQTIVYSSKRVEELEAWLPLQHLTWFNEGGHICRNCWAHLQKHKTPPTAVWNGLQPDAVPDELNVLNELEAQLLALRIAFMKVVRLPAGGQRGIHGGIINVPANVRDTAKRIHDHCRQSLPHTLDNAMLIPVVVKKKLEYRSSGRYKYINPHKVLAGLRWLIANNRLYNDVVENSEWALEMEQDGRCQGLLLSHEPAETNDEDELFEPLEDVGCFDVNGAEVDMPGEQVLCQQDDEPTDVPLPFRSLSLEQSPKRPSQELTSPESTPNAKGKRQMGPSKSIPKIAALNVAPGEGQTPIPLFKDTLAEYLSFPELFPQGRHGFVEKRAVDLKFAQYLRSRIRQADGRFSRHATYMLWALYKMQQQHLLSSINVSLNKSTIVNTSGQRLTVEQARDQTMMKKWLTADQGFRFMSGIRGSPAYWRNQLYNFLGMVRQLGVPTWFLTLSSDDLHWRDVLEPMFRLKFGRVPTDEEIETMSGRDRCALLNQYPAIAAQQFERRVRIIFRMFKRRNSPIGEMVDFAYRYEWQARGSPHLHALIWVKNAPKLGEHTDEQVCDFIDNYCSCAVPDQDEDADLHLLVTSKQVHNHRGTCQTKKATEIKDPDDLLSDAERVQLMADSRCRFNFPRQTSPHTWINYDCEQETMAAATADQLQQIKQTTKASVVMKRKEGELQGKVNNYNGGILKAFRSNMDLSFVVNAYAAITYMCNYVGKAETEVGEAMRDAISKVPADWSDKKKCYHLANVFFNTRHMSLQETAHLILGLPLVMKSRAVMFIPTGFPTTRFRMRKPLHALQELAPSSEDVFVPNLIDKYEARPLDDCKPLQQLSLAQFTAWYRLGKQSDPPADVDNDDSTSAEEDDEDRGDISDVHWVKRLPEVFQLRRGLGAARKLARARVIRYHTFDRAQQEEEYYYSLLLLFFPFENESRDLALRGHRYLDEQNIVWDFANYKEYFMAVEKQVKAAVEQFEEFADLIAMVYRNLETNVNEEINEATEAQFLAGALDMSGPGDVGDDWQYEDVADLIDPDNVAAMHDVLGEQHASQGNVEEIEAEPYEMAPHSLTCDDARALLKDRLEHLNEDQMHAFNAAKERIDEYDMCSQKGEPYLGKNLFISGPGGTGKSFVLQAIRWYAHQKFAQSPEDLVCLVAAPTGSAAIVCDGDTLHHAFSLPVQQQHRVEGLDLSHRKTEQMRNQLRNLAVLILDEISMVSSTNFHITSYRLNKIFGVKDPRVVFGGIVVICCGDLYQLPPVLAPKIFQPVNSRIVTPSSMHLWCDNTTLVELNTIERQRDDHQFAEVLCRVRRGKRMSIEQAKRLKMSQQDWEKLPGYTDADVRFLEARTYAALGITGDDDPRVADATFVYYRNVDVNEHNERKLSQLKRRPGVLSKSFTALDSFVNDSDNSRFKVAAHVPDKSDQTGGLQHTLEIAVGAKVMIRRNLDVADKVVNGSTGTVLNWSGEDGVILVRLPPVRGQPVGQRIRHKWATVMKKKNRSIPPIFTTDPSIVPIARKTVQFLSKNRSSKMQRVQFPVMLCFAISVHKCQGKSLDKAVLSLRKEFKQAGLAYVALSRVTHQSGLFLKWFYPESIRADPQVEEHMQNLRLGLSTRTASSYRDPTKPTAPRTAATTHTTPAAISVKQPAIAQNFRLSKDDLASNSPLRLSEKELGELREMYKYVAAEYGARVEDDNEADVDSELDGLMPNVFPRDFLEVKQRNTWLSSTHVHFFLEWLRKKGGDQYKRTTYVGTEFHLQWVRASECSEAADLVNFNRLNYAAQLGDMSIVRLIYIPINFSNTHWALVIIDSEKREIQYFDSGSQADIRATAVLTRVQDWMKAMMRARKQNAVKWPSVVVECPKQTDTSSCSVFVCAFAELAARRLSHQLFQQADSLMMRLRIMHKLIRHVHENP